MAINDKERQEAVEAVRWLRRCRDSEDGGCRSCPFEGKDCIRLLLEISAELMEEFAEEIKKRQVATPENTAVIVTWLQHCCEKDARQKWCSQCPCNDGEHDCMDQLQSRAADVLEQLIKLS